MGVVVVVVVVAAKAAEAVRGLRSGWEKQGLESYIQKWSQDTLPMKIGRR